MRSPLALAVAQPRCDPRRVESNVTEHATIVGRAGARVVVFPELSLTGYHFDADPVDEDDPRLTPLLRACAEHRTMALVGAPIASDGERYIAVLAVDGDRAAVVYRKMYLGSSEAAAFTPGREPAVIEIDGWRLGLAICKDTGVAAQVDATAALGIDVYAAGVLELLGDDDVQPARARVIGQRHRVWVAVASFAGSTGEGFDVAAGGSTVWTPSGDVVAAVGIEPGGWATALVSDRP